MSVLLCNQAITSPMSGVILPTVDGFGDVTALTIVAQFVAMGGGGTVDLWVRTSIDQGATWIDIAHFAWTTASVAVAVNVSGLVSITTPVAITDGGLTANTVREGILGDRFQGKITSTGVYAGGTRATVNLSPR